ncbi:hypothetical protein FGO68_gene2533 [Halteria grandinella]|uniref:Uncharacterized protein n=1 Tax=Halteria grandinella TaxID=5974 RepID=A0A8J8P7K0_HALGN|nr:hypothetical protein FGO68_gene2533 [Halteria grandinella]
MCIKKGLRHQFGMKILLKILSSKQSHHLVARQSWVSNSIISSKLKANGLRMEYNIRKNDLEILTFYVKQSNPKIQNRERNSYNLAKH